VTNPKKEQRMEQIVSRQVLQCDGETCQTDKHDLIREEPLLIRIEGKPYSVVMRTPGEENCHVAGFCLSEGLVDQPEEIATLGYCNEIDGNVATVTLKPARRDKVSALLERRGFMSQTSCGICGKELIKDLCQFLVPVTDDTRIKVSDALRCVDQLSGHQQLYERTRGSHAALLFDPKLELLAVAEDVGRHNALDKAIGRAFLNRKLADVFLGVLSSRISYELVQKAARAQTAILIGMSRPTALAVELGQTLNMTLACTGEKSGLMVFSGKERLNGGLKP